MPLPSILGGRCAGVRVCAEHEEAWQVHAPSQCATHGQTGWERGPCLRHPEVKADA